MIKTARYIILFDGVCCLCQRSVLFVVKRDKFQKFKLASLQSNIGQQLLNDNSIAQNNYMESVVLLKNGKVYRYSTAILHILKDLDGLWPLCFAFIMIPSPIRDAIYRFIGKHRYRWFGKRKQCWLPDKDIRHRFLE